MSEVEEWSRITWELQNKVERLEQSRARLVSSMRMWHDINTLFELRGKLPERCELRKVKEELEKTRKRELALHSFVHHILGMPRTEAWISNDLVKLIADEADKLDKDLSHCA